MKRWIGLIAAGVVLGVAGSHAQATSRLALAEDLLVAMNMPESIGDTFAAVKQMIPAQTDAMRRARGETNRPSCASSQTDKLIDVIAEEFSWNKVKDDYIALYAETFTDEELKDMIAFYKSPAGRALTRKQPELTRRSMEMSQKWMMKIMPKIQSIMQEMNETTCTPTVQKKAKP